MFDGDNLSFITWFADSFDPNLGVLATNDPNYISNEVYAFVERDGLVYECIVNLLPADGVWVDSYIPNSTMYITSLIVADMPFTGDNGSVSVTFNPGYEDQYDFIFTDEYGCSQSIDFSSDLLVPQEELSFSVSSSPVSCPNGDDGSLEVSIVGGYGPYSVLLLDENQQIYNSVFGVAENTITVFNGVEIGSYYISVIDDLGCEVESSSVSTIDSPSEIVVFNELTTDVSCNSQNENNGLNAGENAFGSASDGSIEFNIQGGTPPYSAYVEELNLLFPVDEATNIFTISNLSSGTYNVSVFDANNCPSFSNGQLIFDIFEPDEMSVTAIISEILCSGGEGDIELFWSGGTPFSSGPQYNYIQPTGVDPDGSNTAITIANSFNQTGYFAEEAVDANGCSVFFEVIMTEPDPIELVGSPQDYITDYNGYQVSCLGADDGQIGFDLPLEIIGGVGDYIFEWYLQGSNQPLSSNNCLVDPCLDNLTSGTYILDVQDENGCQNQFLFDLIEPNPVSISLFEDETGNEFLDYNDDEVNDSDDWLQDVVLDASNQTVSIFGDYGISCYGSNNGLLILASLVEVVFITMNG